MAIWKAKLKNGEEASELTSTWASVKNDIVDLIMITNDNKTVSLPKNMGQYIQFKTAGADLGSKNIQIESRTIGFKLGNNTVKVRVDEKSGDVKIEVE